MRAEMSHLWALDACFFRCDEKARGMKGTWALEREISIHDRAVYRHLGLEYRITGDRLNRRLSKQVYGTMNGVGGDAVRLGLKAGFSERSRKGCRAYWGVFPKTVQNLADVRREVFELEQVGSHGNLF